MSGILDVTITRFKQHADERGALTEVFREHWPDVITPVQWNLVSSRAEVLRGIHVHVTHWDYLMCLEGSLFLGLKDIRPGSPTEGRIETHVLRAAEAAVTIPPGVAHGFYFSEPSKHLYGVTEYWNMADELGCAWDDQDIGIEWPGPVNYLSPRDTQAGSFKAMTAEFLSAREAHQRRAS